MLPGTPGDRPSDGSPQAAASRWPIISLTLLAILALGVLVRLWPLTTFAVWGSDSGEYHLLTRQLLETGEVRFPYEGWGLAYPYFPGMFILDGAFTAIAGADVLDAMRVTVPTVAGVLLPLGIFLIADRVTGDTRVALFASGLLAVASAGVIVTSHAMPGTLGHVLMMAALVALLHGYEDSRFAWLLVPFAAALVLSHHLTTYFLVGTVVAIYLTREVAHPSPARRETRIEGAFLVALLAAVSTWWLFVAGPFRERIIGDVAAGVSPWVVVAVCYALLALVPLLVLAKGRLLPRVRWDPWLPGTSRAVFLTLAGCLTLLWGGLFAVHLFGVPGTDIPLDPVTYLYFIPVSAWLVFFPLGVLASRWYPRGLFVTGWLLAITASTVFAAVTGSRVLFPFRHVEYLVEPLAVLAAMGFFLVWDLHRERAPSVARRARRGAVAAGVAVLLVAAGAAASNLPRQVIGNFEEGMSDAELAAVLWVRDHPEVVPPGAHFAADHRISSLLYGLAGVNATWDTAGFLYHAESWTPEVAEGMRNGEFPMGLARIDYVFLSPEMEAGVTLYQWDPSRPMTPAAVAKFSCPPFDPVYDQGGVRIYRVDWDLVASWPAETPAVPCPAAGGGDR